ncbi:MAG: nucleoside hydrolase [Candidatus Metalachnospira sp.]|nr:nucleoside hydrolase [Candidatus Metalachnospira sp.]
MKIPVFIDCDPGIDDAAAILIANKITEIEIVGVGTVCGNVEASKTYSNCCNVMKFAGNDAPVYMGAEKPMFRDLVMGKYIHQEDGLGGFSSCISCDVTNAPKEKAWDALYREAKKYNGELVLIAIGPLTNIGIALAKYKELPSLLKKIYIMGGAAAYGNITPSAEFNIYVDPEAAEMVFKCGAPIFMCGLDVTEKAYILPEETEKIGELGSKQAKFFAEIFKSALSFNLKHGFNGNHLHDPCTVMAVAYPELFSGKMAGVCVETKARITRGKTVCDYYTDVKFPFQNAYVATDIDREAFINQVTELMSQY